MTLAIQNLVAFILPAYFANAAPVIAGGRTPIDHGMAFVDGKRFLGRGKTLRGILVGLAAGTIAGALLAFADDVYLPGYSPGTKVLVAFLLSLGAMGGDLLGSFIKRRLSIPQGEQHEFFDQLLFLGGALALAAPYYLPSALEAAFLIALTYVLHKATNALAHALNLKKVPW